MTLHIDELGSGPDVVLLHGTPTRPEHMLPLATRLASGGRRALVVHLPGYGRSASVRPYSLERVYEEVEGALRDRHVETADVIGYSYGVYRAFALAARGAVRARSIVALSGYIDLTEEDRRSLAPLLEAVRRRDDLAPIFEQVMLSDRGRRRPDAVAEVRSWATAAAPEHLIVEGAAVLASRDLRPDAALLDTPVLVRVGSDDLASPAARSQRIAAAVPRATLEVVEGVGHAILAEDFEATARSIERHLARGLRRR